MKRALIVAVAVLCLEPSAQAQFDELNLSTDLVRLGIASHNMVRTIRAGDTLVILGQGDGMPWTCHSCTQTAVRDVDVYGGPMFGLTFEDPTASNVEHVASSRAPTRIA